MAGKDIPNARSTSVNDIAPGTYKRCNDNELPNGLAAADAAVVPVAVSIPMETGAASFKGKFWM